MNYNEHKNLSSRYNKEKPNEIQISLNNKIRGYNCCCGISLWKYFYAKNTFVTGMKMKQIERATSLQHVVC